MTEDGLATVPATGTWRAGGTYYCVLRAGYYYWPGTTSVFTCFMGNWRVLRCGERYYGAWERYYGAWERERTFQVLWFQGLLTSINNHQRVTKKPTPLKTPQVYSFLAEKVPARCSLDGQ